MGTGLGCGGFRHSAPKFGFYAVAEKTEGCKQLVDMVPVTVLCVRHAARLLTDTPLTPHNALQSSCCSAPHPALFLGGRNGGSEESSHLTVSEFEPIWIWVVCMCVRATVLPFSGKMPFSPKMVAKSDRVETRKLLACDTAEPT